MGHPKPPHLVFSGTSGTVAIKLLQTGVADHVSRDQHARMFTADPAAFDGVAEPATGQLDTHTALSVSSTDLAEVVQVARTAVTARSTAMFMTSRTPEKLMLLALHDPQPSAFTEQAAHDLCFVLKCGAPCGVMVLMVTRNAAELPPAVREALHTYATTRQLGHRSAAVRQALTAALGVITAPSDTEAPFPQRRLG